VKQNILWIIQKKKRGRPKQREDDDLQESSRIDEEKLGSPRKRGRPPGTGRNQRKMQRLQTEQTTNKQEVLPEQSESKNEVSEPGLGEETFQQLNGEETPVKRGRGRPRKHFGPPPAKKSPPPSEPGSSTSPQTKKKRGRPRKYPTPEMLLEVNNDDVKNFGLFLAEFAKGRHISIPEGTQH